VRLLVTGGAGVIGSEVVRSPVAASHEPVVTGEYRLGDVRQVTAGTARIGTELGWAPDVDVRIAGFAAR
jgi:dTDP-L-rhamnose 4-epimerase